MRFILKIINKKIITTIVIGKAFFLLIIFKMNRIFMYQYDSNEYLGTINGFYIYTYEDDVLKALNSYFVYDGNETMVATISDAYKEQGHFVLELSDTKLFIIQNQKYTDDNWNYRKVSKSETRESCKELAETEAGKCIAF